MYSVWKLIRFSLRIVSISLYPLECIVHFGRRVVCKWDHVSPRRRFSLSRLFCVWCHIFENKLEWMLKRFHLEVFTANCPVGLLDLQLSILMNECHLWTFLLYLPRWHRCGCYCDAISILGRLLWLVGVSVFPLLILFFPGTLLLLTPLILGALCSVL